MVYNLNRRSHVNLCMWTEISISAQSIHWIEEIHYQFKKICHQHFHCAHRSRVSIESIQTHWILNRFGFRFVFYELFVIFSHFFPGLIVVLCVCSPKPLCSSGSVANFVCFLFVFVCFFPFFLLLAEMRYVCMNVIRSRCVPVLVNLNKTRCTLCI